LDPDGDLGTSLRKALLEEAHQPFDLARGPLFRATLFRINAREHVLVIVAHHIVHDGWSSRIFVSELCALYAAYAAGRPSPLPPLLMQYGDFARWQREWFAGPVLEEHVAYWTQVLAGHPGVLDLPGDHPRPAVQTLRGNIVSGRLSATLSEELIRLSRQES